MRILYDKGLAIYRSVPPAEDSVRVCSKEWLFNTIVWVTEIFVGILLSVMAITSKLIFVDRSRLWISSEFVFNEQELTNIYVIRVDMYVLRADVYVLYQIQ